MISKAIYLEDLPYGPDSCQWFERLRGLPQPVFLDSCYPHSRAGRFDIMTAQPSDNFPFICTNTTSYKDVIEYFLELAKASAQDTASLPGTANTLPFCGGLAGYLDYGLGRPLQHMDPEPGAGARINRYGWALVQDHLRERCTFVALPSLAPAVRRELLERLREPQLTGTVDDGLRLTSAFSCNLDRDQYQRAFRQIQRYIQDGDCYQVNLARRFSATFRGDPWSAYRAMRHLAAAPFSAYLDLDGRQLLSLSPERFLRLAGHRVETRPIKGTRPRQDDPVADAVAAEQLQQSVKDRAENLMIVDLLRNDIGRNCTPGSIQVERLFELESYPSVHHLVSTISGELLPGSGPLELLRDSFPGGSITGAPKRRAMQIIDELEPHDRQAYCGTVFYVSADGRMDSNIAIRSLVCEQGNIHCWGGGGIVADSQWQLEYQETWDKVGRFIEALESASGRANTAGRAD